MNVLTAQPLAVVVVSPLNGFDPAPFVVNVIRPGAQFRQAEIEIHVYVMEILLTNRALDIGNRDSIDLPSCSYCITRGNESGSSIGNSIVTVRSLRHTAIDLQSI